MTRNVPIDSETTQEYQDGYAAFNNGLEPDDNPYPRDNPRTNWYNGFYSGRREQFLAGLEVRKKDDKQNKS